MTTVLNKHNNAPQDPSHFQSLGIQGTQVPGPRNRPAKAPVKLNFHPFLLLTDQTNHYHKIVKDARCQSGSPTGLRNLTSEMCVFHLDEVEVLLEEEEGLAFLERQLGEHRGVLLRPEDWSSQ